MSISGLQRASMAFAILALRWFSSPMTNNALWTNNTTLTRILLMFALVGVLGSCTEGVFVTKEIRPPDTRMEPEVMKLHGDIRVDNYYWIRDDNRTDPEVLELLATENNYTESLLAHTETFQDQLFTEITGRLKAEDRSVPVKSKDFLYFQEFRHGQEHPVYLRQNIRKENETETETEVLLDVNQEANGHDYYRIGSWNVSFNQDLLAYTEDTKGRRQYNLRFRKISSGDSLTDELVNVSPTVAWSQDNETLFYVKKHPETLLPYQVYRHRLGDRQEMDQLVYEEIETGFYTSVYRSRSEDYIVILLTSTTSSEVRLIDARHPESEPVVFIPREADHEYRIRHQGDNFYVMTNLQAKNFRIMRVKEEHLSDLKGIKAHWQEIVPHRKDTLIEDMELFKDRLIVNERSNGLSYLKVMSTDGEFLKNIDFPDPVYTVSLHSNMDKDASVLRYVYNSLTVPNSVYEFDFETQLSMLVKREEVVGSYDPTQYQSERIWVLARDGVKVPVSLVYRKDALQKGSNPLYLYGYGAYGYSTDPYFRSKRLSLLERGFVIALIHVRGGSEMGRQWYESGKLFHKKNTFFDFIDATRALTESGWGDKDKVFAAGGSAGGLLMGVIANEAPELYKGIVAHVPFVDMVTTMLDESIPLTTEEYEEWGNPAIKEDYDYMLSYSPYDQVAAKSYPSMLVTTGLYDSQVQYFEPVKWVSKLRQFNQSDNSILLKIEMDAGHSGASGRYEQYKMDALEYAYILDALDINK